MIQTIAARLTSDPTASVARSLGGGNNTIYEILSHGRQFALKQYPNEIADPRKRQKTEINALSFLSNHGMQNIPMHIATWENYTLFSWLDGRCIQTPKFTDIERAMELLVILQAHSHHADAAAIESAYESCVSLDILLSQLKQRSQALYTKYSADPEIIAFLHGEVTTALTTFRQHADGIYARCSLPTTILTGTDQRLIHGDYGLHNMLKRANGELQLLDFEYFGWDDPVKMIADFALHPGVALDSKQRSQWLMMARTTMTDKRLQHRILALFPLFALRWALITLGSVNAKQQTPEHKERQLQKASLLLTLPSREGLV